MLDHLNEEDMAAFAISHRCHWDDVMATAEDPDDTNERRIKLLKLLIRAVLAYECLPEALGVYSLGDNATYPTTLAIPSIRGGEPLRVRVEQRILPPSTSVNFYSKIVDSNLKASNGALLRFSMRI
jgi:hypothetical protein